MCGGLAKGYALAWEVATGYALAWDVAAGYALVWVRLRVLGISGAVPLSLQKNAKGGEKVTQRACGSNKCHFSSNAFSCALRGSHAPEIRHPNPDPGQR